MYSDSDKKHKNSDRLVLLEEEESVYWANLKIPFYLEANGLYAQLARLYNNNNYLWRKGMTEKNFLTKTLTDTALTRRSFLKWSAALGGTTALAGGLNYGLKAAEETAVSEGEWIVAACWHNCGGRCPGHAPG